MQYLQENIKDLGTSITLNYPIFTASLLRIRYFSVNLTSFLALYVYVCTLPWQKNEDEIFGFYSLFFSNCLHSWKNLDGERVNTLFIRISLKLFILKPLK